ncbi:cutinase [Clohesyomyces aquaticus]|uniref:Cutinase n=1 Tax=Clohesyomyces aquaticus TaxID=1231657 RepID=A0A1Y1YU57_9PLEO|nr:cutinase [Clohesyomyces aquaticus]
MKLLQALTLAAVVTALPTAIEVRQLDKTGLTESEFSRSTTCGKVIFVWARGSTEAGNMGAIIGMPLGDELRKKYGRDLQIEGISYKADLAPNYLPGGTDRESWGMMKSTLEKVNQRCPTAKVVAGGYSQGAAVIHRGIEGLAQAVKDQIVGVVTFGDTQKTKDKGVIPNFPADKLKIFCAGGTDTVCLGNLAAAVLPPHLSYTVNADEAGRFLIGKVGSV